MVYPTLEAATPPPLVQSFTSSAQVSAFSPSPAPATQPVRAEEADIAVQSLSSTLETRAEPLGPPLQIPPPESPRFFTTPNIGLQADPNSFSGFAPFTRVVAQTNPDATKSPDLAPGYPGSPTTIPTAPAQGSQFVNLTADSQEYDTLQQVVTAVGNVLLNYRTARLKADRIQTLVLTKQAIAEGNVQLTQGGQVLQGDRLEYQLDQERGILFKPRGVINLPANSSDRRNQTPTSTATGSNPLVSVPDSLQKTDTPTLRATSGLQRLRFEADRIEFTARTWTAVNIRITNDPFSPPELEVRADQAQRQQVSAQEDIVTLKRPRLVFDQRIGIPIPRSVIGLSRKKEDPFSISIGYDDRDRGGLFVGQKFTPISNRTFSLTITPQIFLERAVLSRDFNFLSPDVYGLDIALKNEFSPTTRLGAYLTLNSFDLTDFANNVRAGFRLEHLIDDYRLDFEAAYRERVLNGSLGEQTILNRAGVIFNAPTRPIANTGIDLNYRVSGEVITANTDRFGPLDSVSLGRFQGSATVERAFDLWKGKTLPPTATEGLRYTAAPVQPYFRLIAGVTGVVSGYTNGDYQASLIGKVRFQGQFGHFSRPFLDYTGFYIGFSQGLNAGESPFLFDRFVDQQVLSAGFLQQVYGPIRLGFQTSINLQTGEFFNTDIILDYSRRTYGINLRYNPDLQVGSIVFRINSFNWESNRDPLLSPSIGVVEGGVDQTNDPF